MFDELLARFRSGDRLALSRLLTHAAQGEHLAELLAALPSPEPPARVIAVTGSAGVGKSTLIGKLLSTVRTRHLDVAVLACDPQSPLTGGALLGDRFRMPAFPEDQGVFIRSLAAAPGRGALADHLRAMIRLLESFGFQIIVVETVGAGQTDVAVRELADVVVLVLQPEAGDELQWEKAGVLEVANVIAINKADLPQAQHVLTQVSSTLEIAKGPRIPVLLVSAKTGEGIEKLWETIAAGTLHRDSWDERQRDLLTAAQQWLADRFDAVAARPNPELGRVVAQWQEGKIETAAAAERLVTLLSSGEREER
jgi:LAO/AO transport system ATPase